MYQVKIYDGPDDHTGTLIHVPNTGKLKLSSGKINAGINTIDTFDFDFNHGNPAFNQIKPLKTLMEVINARTNILEFKGRVLRPSKKMSSSGFHESFVAESDLGYLHDSHQEYHEFRGTLQQLFERIINRHNMMVEPYKRFKIGKVEPKDPNDYYRVFLDYDETSFDAIKRTLLDKYGGELRLRYEYDGVYLDYLNQIGRRSDIEIAFRKNLQSLTVDIDPTNIITRLIPLGKTIEDEDAEVTEETSDVKRPRVNITSVNDGKEYLDRPDLISRYGIQTGSETWNDIQQPAILKTRGQQFLDRQKLALHQYKVTAVDLSLIGLNLDSFEVGNWHRLFNPVMSVDEEVRIIKKTIDINSPQKSNLTIGDQFQNTGDMYFNNVYTLSQELSLIKQDFNRMESLRIGAVRDVERLRKELAEAEKRLQEQIDAASPSGQDPVFPVDYTRSGINFWTNSNGMYYGAPRDGGTRQHAGYDIGGGGSKHPIHAVQDGIVSSVGWISGLGNTIKIRHTGDKYHSLYGHLDSTSVSAGDTVRRGQQIGIMGGTGGDYAIHLHFELSETGQFHTMANTLDPAPYLGVTRDNYTTLENPVNV